MLILSHETKRRIEKETEQDYVESLDQVCKQLSDTDDPHIIECMDRILQAEKVWHLKLVLLQLIANGKN